MQGPPAPRPWKRVRTVSLYNDRYRNTAGTRLVSLPICPDTLTYDDIGAADTMRGWIVRAFFLVLRWLP